MSAEPISAYSFIPWARQGLGIHIGEQDLDAGVRARGSIDVTLRLAGARTGGGEFSEELPPRAVQLYGPGDILGIDAKAIVRTEPRHWITNFETNYMPFIEFYDEDFPWRYTPARASADNRRLRPWLALAVLEEGEIQNEGPGGLGRPLPFIQLAEAARKLPPADQLWAWAHVHVDGGFTIDPTDAAAVATQLEATVRANRDRAYSRLLCPRILEPNTGYHAFVLPVFESGRLAGLGHDPDDAPFATASAWAEYPGRNANEGDLFPYYFRWYFRTGMVGDFEYLVRLLQPRTVDPRVGRRDIDVQSPGANLPGIPGLGGVLRLGGALRAPLETLSDDDRREYDRYERWGAPYPHPFQTALAALVNLASDYRAQAPDAANAATGLDGVTDDEDPLIVPPLYGRWHSQTQRLEPAEGDPDRRRWVHELNLDPRHRVAAGFGTQIVQTNQESYMEAAWQQVGKVLEANERIRFAQMAKLTSLVWHARELAPMQRRSAERFLALAAPVQRRVVANGLTVHHQVKQSALPAAATSKTFRQLQRPRARISRLAGFDADRRPDNLLQRMNLEDADPRKVSAAPPKAVAPVLPTEERIARELTPSGLPYAWLDLLRRQPWVMALLLAIALLLVLLLFFVALVAALVAAGIVVVVAAWAYRLVRRARAARVLDSETRTSASIDEMPASPDFRIGTPGREPAPRIGGSTDSGDARRFKEALRNGYSVDEVERAIAVPVRRPLDVPAIAAAAVEVLDPAVTVPTRALTAIRVPPRIRDRLPGGTFDEIMVYPEIDVPMYEPLKDVSSELFLPQIQLVENNSITLLETNQKFIESYMVGLNHEFARELLWREYPTDQRGSYFRQFWDVRGFLAEAGSDPEALRERLRDIPELHKWLTDSGLGDHDHREAQGDKEDEVVLVIRGELLKKYPTAVISAHRAAWERTRGAIDMSRPRKLAELTEEQAKNPPRDLVKSPLYEAKVDPDIYFFGFDLTVEKALGGQIVDGEEDPGWFFVIEERPGEPRFGLDLPQDGVHSLYTWNDLAWTDVVDELTAGAYLHVGEKTVTLIDPGTGSDAKTQHDEDSRFAWRAETHAAELAYILFQVPVLMAVHAAEMLKRPG
jgi:hypothetical protein